MSRKKTRSPLPADAFWEGPGAALLALCGVLVPLVFNLKRGFGATYTHVVDGDIIFSGQALLLNANLPQTFFDHTAYFYLLLVSKWYGLLHGVGLIPVADMSSLLRQKAFGAAYAPLVYWARGLACLLIAVFSLTFGWVVARLTDRRFLGGLAVLALASAEGSLCLASTMRPEPLCVEFVLLAFALPIVFQKDGESKTLLAFGLSGFLGFLAMSSKIQSIFELACLPTLWLFFLRRTQPKSGTRALVAVSVAVALVCIPLLSSLDRNLFHGIQFYQAGFLAAILLPCVYWLARKQGGATQAALAYLAALGGAGCAYFFQLVDYNPINDQAIFNFYDHMMWFMQKTAGSVSFTQKLLHGLAATLASKVDPAIFSVHHLQLLYLPVTLGAVWAWRRGKHRLALQAGVLLAFALLQETLCRIKHFNVSYYIWVDDVILLAGFLLAGELLAGLKPAARCRAYAAGALAAVALAAVSFQSGVRQLGVEGDSIWGFFQKPEAMCNRYYIYNDVLAEYLNRDGRCPAILFDGLR